MGSSGKLLLRQTKHTRRFLEPNWNITPIYSIMEWKKRLFATAQLNQMLTKSSFKNYHLPFRRSQKNTEKMSRKSINLHVFQKMKSIRVRHFSQKCTLWSEQRRKTSSIVRKEFSNRTCKMLINFSHDDKSSLRFSANKNTAK